MSQHKVVLLLGSNLGDKDNNIQQALTHMKQQCGPILNYSKIITTNPVEFASNNNFRNIAVEISTEHSPICLLNRLKTIEKLLGRTKDSSVTEEFKDRTIDIDIVIFDFLLYKSKVLEIPHKGHLYNRKFSRRLIKELGY